LPGAIPAVDIDLSEAEASRRVSNPERYAPILLESETPPQTGDETFTRFLLAADLHEAKFLAPFSTLITLEFAAEIAFAPAPIPAPTILTARPALIGCAKSSAANPAR